MRSAVVTSRLSIACLLAGVGLSCATRAPEAPAATARGQVSATLALSTYYEEGPQIALIVGSRPAQSRRDRPYIPIEIAVVNKGQASLTVTPESFTLVSPEGASFPPVSREELSRGYGSTDVDRRLGEIEAIVQGRYQTYDRIPSNFAPGFDAPIAREEVALPRFSYLVDTLYFPNPAVPTPVGPFEILVRVAELPDPMVVRFFVGRPR